jgi:hypothetical protein
MEQKWVDFKRVKDAVNIQMVLDHYEVKKLSTQGHELRGPCPIHKGTPRNKTFTVNVQKNAFKCFARACAMRGNVLDLVAAMERCSVREAAIKLQEWFKIGESLEPSGSKISNEECQVSRGIYRGETGDLFELVTTATSVEDSARVAVYRELFGDYEFWTSPVENFSDSPGSSVPQRFTLIKTLS